MRLLKKIMRILFITLLTAIGLLTVALLLLWWRVSIPDPKVDKKLTTANYVRKQTGPDSYAVNNCWLRKNKYGIWEMYLEGAPYERGLIYGVLAKELIQRQEEVFVNQINELVPNRFYQQVLKLFIAWFNRDIYKNIPEENLQEIYGVSQSFADKYDYVGPKYYRILYYHGAHDIGHALNDFNMVGCTSFAVNKESSKDGSLLIGRNFDFYMGEEFAKEKMIVFVKPTTGYKFASYSWAGLTGVVSGMNEMGVTVTLNASKSDLPMGAKDPISILAREILQYAKNKDEAIAIAKAKETFVSESLLIGSAADDKAIIIEKSPLKWDVYESSNSTLVCANHYQGEIFMKDSVNLNNIQNSDSKYRFDRVNELLSATQPIDYLKAAAILRNRQGVNGKNIGMGNPKSLNQLIAHHAVIFKPGERNMWVSTPPYQLGAFVCYNISAAFAHVNTLTIDSLTIPADSFVATNDFNRYEHYKKIKELIKKHVMMGAPVALKDAEIQMFISDNPDCYLTYMVLGDFYKKEKESVKAIKYYRMALERDVASVNERALINKKLKSLIGQ